MLFVDFIHTQKRNPQTNTKCANMFWDFLSGTPESAHQVTILFSDRGTPRTYRHMNGYSSHTFKMVNADGKQVWVKFHFKTEQGIENLTAEESERIAGENPDHATEDLFNSIASGTLSPFLYPHYHMACVTPHIAYALSWVQVTRPRGGSACK